MKRFHFLFGYCLLLCLINCKQLPPEAARPYSQTISLYPDYQDITIPYNIAPLNFRIETTAEDYKTFVTGKKGKPIFCKGQAIHINVKQWSDLLQANKSDSIHFEIYLKLNGEWYRYLSKPIQVAEEPIDEYLSYRLIEPSYHLHGALVIRQRHLTDFNEKDIYNNQLLFTNHGMECINCHAYQNYRTSNMQFHVRNYHPGTVIVSDGKMKKVALKSGSLISNGVYPAWHPNLKLIAYSVNSTGQLFYEKDVQKVEVLDKVSDLVLYNVEANTVDYIQNHPDELENFPAWSPDGKLLYYVSASLSKAGVSDSVDYLTVFNKIRYDLMRIPFDQSSMRFGRHERLVAASDSGRSITLPRVSPDGNYVLYTMGDYGCFHIWHNSSDLYLLDLQTNKNRKLENVNSDNVESFHNWSSNGRWIVFSSRRDDGSYTRFYFSYFDRTGHAHKPFLLPQEDPLQNQRLMKSYNIPEFMVEPVDISARQFAHLIKGDAEQAEFTGEQVDGKSGATKTTSSVN